MQTVHLDESVLSELEGKTAIVTGGAGGIGGATVRLLNARGANVVIADLARMQNAAEALISSLSASDSIAFQPTNIVDWTQMKKLFQFTVGKFGSVDIVVGNAAVMESASVLDPPDVDPSAEPEEPLEAFRVIDINLKGTLNTLRLAFHHMKSNPPRFSDGSKGSIVLVSSTSAYWGATGVVAYAASKHGVTGLLRSSQREANALKIRVNAVAPFFTPTQITTGFASKFAQYDINANTPERVGSVIVDTAANSTKRGACCLVAAETLRELEVTRTELLPEWIGKDLAETMGRFAVLLKEMGGYPMPKLSFD